MKGGVEHGGLVTKVDGGGLHGGRMMARDQLCEHKLVERENEAATATTTCDSVRFDVVFGAGASVWCEGTPMQACQRGVARSPMERGWRLLWLFSCNGC
ncbi:hypothetical protein TIFTF001_032798 [Ficus carica]|uniref:Uncharacterized protein n=1 Tax=Ficus carica TaxID=3494 RepID=A0AA88J758_FICCA|nr:hypothetical protein TIFTF001_032798 [Ficus carica]